MALLQASITDDLANVIYLVKTRAEIDFLGHDYKTALQHAAENGHQVSISPTFYKHRSLKPKKD